MGAGSTPLVGPDFSVGIDETDVKENTPLLGRVGEEPVLLVRTGDDIFAVSATCPHYGAPLVEGCVFGREIRCPWHHAAFDLATGEATRAPALNPLSCYQVLREKGRIFVKGRETKPAPKRAATGSHIVIVGAGAAGNAAAEMLRRLGFQGAVTMISAESDLPYDKPNLSKDYLAGNAPEEWIPLRTTEFYKEQDIELRLGVSVTKVDPSLRQVVCEDGETLRYDSCLIATGATPVKLHIPGHDLPHVHYLRTLSDSRELIAQASTAREAVIVGSGFIGLEAAAALRARGLSVTVVTLDEQPLERVLGPTLGAYFKSLHEEQGVRFVTKAQVSMIDQEFVRLANGETIAADLILVGIGVKPDLKLAHTAQLALHKDGVSVSETLETSAPGLYAAGDLASWPDPRTDERMRIEHWTVAERQGQTVAKNMLGQRTPFCAVPFFWTSQYGATLAYVGHASSWDAIEVRGEPAQGEATFAYLSHGTIRAVATIGRDQLSLCAEEALERDDQQVLQKLVGL